MRKRTGLIVAIVAIAMIAAAAASAARLAAGPGGGAGSGSGHPQHAAMRHTVGTQSSRAVAGVRHGKAVWFGLRSLKGCVVAYAHVAAGNRYQSIVPARLQHAIRRGSLSLALAGRHPSLRVACSKRRAILAGASKSYSSGSRPTNTALPAVGGSPIQGSGVTTSTGSWAGAPTSYRYQWQRCKSGSCSNIKGATLSSYTLRTVDVGTALRSVVTAVNSYGSGSARSPLTATVQAPAPTNPPAGSPPANISAPALSGTASQGNMLSSSTGSWSNSPSGYSYRWQDCDASGANCQDIASASGASYTLQSTDVGQTVRSVVTAANAYGSASASSSATAPVQGTAGGGGTPVVFNGTFDSNMSNYPLRFGNCYSVLNSTELEYNITSSCNPGSDGHYRTDVSTGLGDGAGNVYTGGVPLCTSIPIQFPNGIGGVPDSTWLGFAQAVATGTDGTLPAGWGLGLDSYWTGNSSSSPSQYVFNVVINGSGTMVWHSASTVDTGWHTLSVCDNDATDNSGMILGLWLDGVRQTFNVGPCAGSQTCGGFPMITGQSYPLDINDYTGGTPAPNVMIHGAPLIASPDSNGMPPQQPGGWNSP